MALKVLRFVEIYRNIARARYPNLNFDNITSQEPLGQALKEWLSEEGIILADGSIPFTGDQSMGGNKLTDLATPTLSGDGANKYYVDNFGAGSVCPRLVIDSSFILTVTASGEMICI